MALDDAARRWTDAELEDLERRMAESYRQAAREMRKKQESWLAKFAKEREQREKALDDTKEALDAHRRWLQSQAVREKWFKDMVDGLAESAHRANEKAMDMLNDHLPRVYAENANRAAYAIDKAVRADTKFTLVNEDAVRYLMGDKEMGQLIHEVTLTPEQQRMRAGLQSMRKDMDAAKDVRWNRQKFTSAITQGIMQGESIPNIVKRTESIYGMNRNAAIRAARTATTSAENAGRMNSFERAQRLGIDMEIEWLATLDERTRESHRMLDGERIKLGEYFETENGPIRWPGDPQADPAETWNCRCRADGEVVGFDGNRGDWADEGPGERWSRLPQGMTYEQWKAGKPVSRAESYLNEWARVDGSYYAQLAAESISTAYSNGFAGVMEGQDILGTWQRRPEQYDFEIEDVMAAQGFDGKPRIVDADEFDRAVKQANGGDGLIMQRTYSAPDQATLDAYRDMLYDGKWYVDCSTGGAQYGQGMYAAADYTGKLSQGIRNEMEHYAELGKDRLRSDYILEQKKKITAEAMSEKSGSTIEQARAYIRYKNGSSSALKEIGMDAKTFTSLNGAWNNEVEIISASYKGRNYVETMTLDPSAKIVTYQELQGIKQTGVSSLMIEATGEEPIVQTFFRMTSQLDVDSDDVREARRYVARLAESNPAENERIIGKANELLQRGRENIQSMRSMDDGSLAAALGYDAINATGHGASGSYTVVLNRTKLIIRRPE